jgi:hypothetical protein
MKVSLQILGNEDETVSVFVTRPFSYEVDGLFIKLTTVYDFDKIVALEINFPFETCDFYSEANGFEEI